MLLLPELLAIMMALCSLGIFVSGLVLAIFELSAVAPAVLTVGLGLVGLFTSWVIWLLAPNLANFFGALVNKNREYSRSSSGHSPHSAVFYPNVVASRYSSKGEFTAGRYDMNADTTETLMRSIRGIPYLIQAIQYSLETTIMSELHGQSAVNSSVIHTAPGCHSVLDCESAEEQACCGGPSNALNVLKSVSPRTSGPEEQWQEDSGTHRNLWVNQQLKLQLHPLSSRASNSSLAVFPYSEVGSPAANRSDSFEEPVSTNRQNTSFGDAEHTFLRHCGGSVQSSLSRVTIAHHVVDKQSQQEIRCIGMSSAFLSRFNNSFRT